MYTLHWCIISNKAKRPQIYIITFIRRSFMILINCVLCMLLSVLLENFKFLLFCCSGQPLFYFKHKNWQYWQIKWLVARSLQVGAGAACVELFKDMRQEAQQCVPDASCLLNSQNELVTPKNTNDQWECKTCSEWKPRKGVVLLGKTVSKWSSVVVAPIYYNYK